MMIPKANLAEPTANSYRAKPHALVIDDDIAVTDTVAMVYKFEMLATPVYPLVLLQTLRSVGTPFKAGF
jgi:hypothetical protein